MWYVLSLKHVICVVTKTCDMCSLQVIQFFNEFIIFFRFGPRFPSMNGVYDIEYQKSALEIAKELGYGDFMQNGVYCMVSGPCYETPAELRFIQTVCFRLHSYKINSFYIK